MATHQATAEGAGGGRGGKPKRKLAARLTEVDPSLSGASAGPIAGGRVDLGDYLVMKERFETHHAYVYTSNLVLEMNPTTKEIRYYALEHAAEYLVSWCFETGDGPTDNVPFFPIWRRDPAKRMVKGVTNDPDEGGDKFFQPIVFADELFDARAQLLVNGAPEEDDGGLAEALGKMGLVYETPTWNGGAAAATDEGDAPERVLTVQAAHAERINGLFDELLEALAGPPEGETSRYLLDYLAHLIQRPTENPGVAIILTGGKGIGKDTLVKFLVNHVVAEGFGHIYTTGKQFWGEHDFFRVGKLLACWEEPDKKSMTKNAAELRALVTASVVNANPKGKDAFVTPNNVRYFFTTNEANPTGLNHDGDVERRFFIINCSPALKGRYEDFFVPLHEHLMTPLGGYVISKRLRARDISGRVIFRIPVTEHMKQLLQDDLGEIDLFVQAWRALEVQEDKKVEYAVKDLYERFQEWHDARGEDATPILTFRQFSMGLAGPVTSGKIVRRTGGHKESYYKQKY